MRAAAITTLSKKNFVNWILTTPRWKGPVFHSIRVLLFSLLYLCIGKVCLKSSVLARREPLLGPRNPLANPLLAGLASLGLFFQKTTPHIGWPKVPQKVPQNMLRNHTWARGGGRGGCTPLRVKNKSPPLHQKIGYPSLKILDLLYSIPPLLGFFYCACLFFHKTEKLKQLANDL